MPGNGKLIAVNSKTREITIFDVLNALNFSSSVFLIFWLWAKDLHILDCKFGFYVKKLHI